MPPRPEDYEVSVDELIRRLKLYQDIEIFQTGIEFMYDDKTRQGLYSCYDKTGLLLRTTPDFVIKTKNETFFVEAKQTTNSIEAIGLYYNKQKERNGIKVLYSFPDLTIPSTMIPMEEIQVPKKYRIEFDELLKDLFIEEGCNFHYWSSNPKTGSGDPFVWIDEDELRTLAEGA